MENKKKYLLKVDISGIQEFIFNVPGKGASRNLKGRSFFIQALTEIAEKFFEDITGGKEVLYNGGGNLFIYLSSTKEELEEAIRHFQSCFKKQVVFPFIAYVEAENDDLFGEQMKQLNVEITKRKLKRPVSFEVEEPLNTAQFDKNFKVFTQNMVAASGYKIESTKEVFVEVNETSFDVAGYKLQLNRESNPKPTFENSIINAMPVGDKGILDFDHIAEKAQARKADDKLAALKIDVDNLGLLFRNRTKEQYKILSKGIQRFFAENLYTELQQHIDSGEVYPVFSGGDDCFLIGAWDVILVIASQIQQKFHEFQTELCKKIGIQKSITISAGIVICNPKYPIMRMAETAEKALGLAKEYGKERVCIFGEVLQWNEFAKAGNLAQTLKKLIIEQGESRALLERIRSSEIGFRSLQNRAVNLNTIDFPKVYRLKYYLRNAKKAESRKILEQEFDKYAEALLNDFVNQEKESNAAQFPVAARWAELLTKSGNS